MKNCDSICRLFTILLGGGGVVKGEAFWFKASLRNQEHFSVSFILFQVFFFSCGIVSHHAIIESTFSFVSCKC